MLKTNVGYLAKQNKRICKNQPFTIKQKRTLKGQALCGDLDGAIKEYWKIKRGA